LVYPESLFSLLSILLLLVILLFIREGDWKNVVAALLLSGLMALCRPTHLGLGASLVGALALSQVFIRDNSLARKRGFIILTVALLGTLAFTAAYFRYIETVTSDFFSAMKSQEGFGRKWSFYWEHFYAPKTLNGSDNIFAWEIQCFYLPLIATGIFASWHSFRRQLQGAAFYIFWICVLFAGAHVGANILTHPRFYALGRHVMSQPFLFIFLAILTNSAPRTYFTKVGAGFYVLASFVYLTMTWERFAKGSWIG